MNKKEERDLLEKGVDDCNKAIASEIRRSEEAAIIAGDVIMVLREVRACYRAGLERIDKEK